MAKKNLCTPPNEIVNFIDTIRTNDVLQEKLTMGDGDLNIGCYELEEIKSAIYFAFTSNIMRITDSETFMKLSAILGRTLDVMSDEEYKAFYDAHYKKSNLKIEKKQ